MERLFRIIFLALFIIGFVGAVASADKETMSESENSLIRDVKLAEEVNALNEGRWEQDTADVNEDGFSRIEAILGEQSEKQTAQK